VHAELAAALAALEPVIGAAESEPVALDGGITNRNFRLLAGGRDVVVRLPGKDTELLGIDRVAERVATEAASGVGVGPQVVAFLLTPPCLVTAFIAGRPLAAEELRALPLVADVAAALRAVHAGPRLPSRFDAFAIVDAYRATATARGAPIPGVFDELLDGAHAIQSALTGPEHAPVPCHNDLLTANFLHDGTRVRIVDWEYAGMGDRYFDLGNVSVNNGFAEADDERLLAEYWNEPCTPRRFAALRLMRIMSDFREGMWGVVQRGISALDFDFAAYADDHLARVRAGLADPRFPTWLEDARGDQS
jgi:aminoglycoside phosphotransferase (APT) family kinase protein